MAFRDDLRADLVRDEGYRLRLYKDSKGIQTVGIGHNIDANGISHAVAELMYAEDIAEVERILDVEFPWWRTLDEPRQRVVMNLTFNLGPQIAEWTTTMGRIQARDYLGAAEALLSNRRWAAQVGKRAQRLADLLTSTVPEGIA